MKVSSASFVLLKCNGPSSSLANIVFFGLSLLGFPLRFLNAFVRERFPHPYKECFVLLPNRRGISQSTSFGAQRSCWHSFPSRDPQSTPFRAQLPCARVHPLWDSTASLAHRPMSGSDTIYNSSSLPLADIVHFGPLHKAVNLMILKRIQILVVVSLGHYMKCPCFVITIIYFQVEYMVHMAIESS